MTDGHNCYMYCIARGGPEGPLPDVAGQQGAAVFGIRYKDLTAYVSETPLTHMDTNYENLRRHEDVIAEIMKERELLPMCFSAICRSQAEVAEILCKYYDQFDDNLAHIAGKIELGIKVFYRLDPDGEDRAESGCASAKEFMMKKFERYMRDQKREREILAAVEDFHKTLSEISADCRSKKPMKNNLIFNASYLVPKNAKEEFDRAVKEIVDNNPTYKILYSGPWPAYHFTKIISEGDEDERQERGKRG